MDIELPEEVSAKLAELDAFVEAKAAPSGAR